MTQLLDTRVPIDNSNVSDILGVSCVIINDLKQRRQKDYDFTWDKVLQVYFKSLSGYLQNFYTVVYTYWKFRFPWSFGLDFNTHLRKNSGRTSVYDMV